MNYPAMRLNIDRIHASEMGLSQKDVVQNVITALNSNTMIAPNYWVDYKTGNDYFLTVQYYEHGAGAIHNLVGTYPDPSTPPGGPALEAEPPLRFWIAAANHGGHAEARRLTWTGLVIPRARSCRKVRRSRTDGPSRF